MPRRVHFIGIGGIGLSAIARILMARGIQVSGSDMRASSITDELSKAGARVSIGHRAENLGDAELVVVTSAAPADNPEVIEAARRGIRIVKRYDFLSELTAGKTTIAVAGTHGKTTTTAMIATILLNAGLDPDVVVGGVVPELGSNAHAGNGEYFVIEADEYDRAFLGLRPWIAVVTSIEMDHPDVFRDVGDVARAFCEFVALVQRDGAVIGYGDAEHVTGILESTQVRTLRYGLGAANDWRASDSMRNSRGGSDFIVWCGDAHIGRFELQIPGTHNVLNALAALAVADRIGVDKQSARETLRQFRGVARRFEVKGEFGGVTIVDDYAHHPSEIRATLAAARERYAERAIWAVFQPHTYSRTEALLDDFASAFANADHVIITEIYSARERKHEHQGVSGAQIVERMNHRDVRFIASLDASAKFLLANLKPGDVLITLGAGDVNRIGEIIARPGRGA